MIPPGGKWVAYTGHIAPVWASLYTCSRVCRTGQSRPTMDPPIAGACRGDWGVGGLRRGGGWEYYCSVVCVEECKSTSMSQPYSIPSTLSLAQVGCAYYIFNLFDYFVEGFIIRVTCVV